MKLEEAFSKSDSVMNMLTKEVYCKDEESKIPKAWVIENVWNPVIKEPDYSFNQNIIDALREGRTVWFKCFNIDWSEVDIHSNFASFYNIIKGQWSLTKPKVMVKKKVARWVIDDAFAFLESGLNTRIVMNPEKTDNFNKKVTIEWEQEE